MLQALRNLGPLVLITLVTVASQAHGTMLEGTVLRVSDGDTVQLSPKTAPGAPIPKKISIRFKNVDTPETHLSVPGEGDVSQGFWGEQATKMLESLVQAGDPIEVETNELDAYGRSLGRVIYKGRDLNLEMVRSGWSSFYVICNVAGCDLTSSVITDLRAACDEAENAGLGIFDPKKPIPELPYRFRARMQERAPHRLVGNLNTKKFVQPEAYESVPICDRVFFEDLASATVNGYTTAK